MVVEFVEVEGEAVSGLLLKGVYNISLADGGFRGGGCGLMGGVWFVISCFRFVLTVRE